MRPWEEEHMPAKSLQSCTTLCDLLDCSPPGSSVHRDSAGKNTKVGCHSPGGSSRPRDQTHASVSSTDRRVLSH